jgi:hypothetical protein
VLAHAGGEFVLAQRGRVEAQRGAELPAIATREGSLSIAMSRPAPSSLASMGWQIPSGPTPITATLSPNWVP